MSRSRTLLFLAFVSCVHLTPLAASPTVRYEIASTGATPIWPGLEEAVHAANEVIQTEFPTWSDGITYDIAIWGPNDRMNAIGHCVDGPTIKYVGCTDRDCASAGGLSCRWVVSARQILRDRSGPTDAPTFSGPLLEACDDTVDGGCAILYELADRYVPLRLGTVHSFTDIANAHTDPKNVARRTKMIARYRELRKPSVR